MLVINAPPGSRYTDEEIDRRIEGCPKLASLKSINRALTELVNSEQGLNSQIAEIIRRDPSLTTRLLRLVNSVFFGLATKVNNIEEAVFFLGLRQIRELATATPVIEELEKLHRSWPAVPWKELWKHSIGSAIMTREILATTSLMIDDDTDYIIGLLHNVGKVVMAYAFPDDFREVLALHAQTPAEVVAAERALIGLHHGEIGARYLRRHRLSPEITESIEYHNTPELAPHHSLLASAVQLADRLVCYAGIPGGLENLPPPEPDSWLELSGWRILFGSSENETLLAKASILNKLQRLPGLLHGLV
jgi:HD-like signal output (HDOD) protein